MEAHQIGYKMRIVETLYGDLCNKCHYIIVKLSSALASFTYRCTFAEAQIYCAYMSCPQQLIYCHKEAITWTPVR